ncbi:hypothetical protein ACWDKQ_16690 [Saccharopolyspora sp. NPDC000995]
MRNMVIGGAAAGSATGLARGVGTSVVDANMLRSTGRKLYELGRPGKPVRPLVAFGRFLGGLAQVAR